MTQTLCILKPDAYERQLLGSILSDIQAQGFHVQGAKVMHLSAEKAAQFYEIHAHRPFFGVLVGFMSSGPVMILALSGKDAVNRFRLLMGHTDPKQAEVGTLRHRYGISIDANTVHGSDSPENAQRELKFFFAHDELLPNLEA